MAELCDLTAIELRRLIGSKKVSPRELLASCRARIDQVNPAVNAFVATCWERAETEAKAAERAVMGGERLGPLHGLPLGVKDLRADRGPAHHLRLAAVRRLRARGRRAPGERRARGRRHRGRQDQHARVRRRRQHGQPGLWRDRQPVRPREDLRGLLGRLGGGARHRHGAASPPAPIPAAACATPPPIAASSASGRARAWCRASCACSAGRPCRSRGRWPATSPTWPCCSRR